MVFEVDVTVNTTKVDVDTKSPAESKIDTPYVLVPHALENHTNVAITNPGAQNVLWYDVAQQKWVNTIAPWLTEDMADLLYYPRNSNPAGYLTSYTETDPIFIAHPAASVTNQRITNWDAAFVWGNHAGAGYVVAAGKAGGQTVNGGTAAGENLTLQSTSHATKGKILFGANSAYDGVNNRLGVGTVSPTEAAQIVGNIYVGAAPYGGTNRIYLGIGANLANSPYIGGAVGGGFELWSGPINFFITSAGGNDTQYLIFRSNTNYLRFNRNGYADYTPNFTALSNNDHTWLFGGTGNARATASDVFAGVQINQTLNAGANNQTLDALRVNSTINVGAFTGVLRNLLRLTGTGSVDVFTVRPDGAWAFAGGTVAVSDAGYAVSGYSSTKVVNLSTAPQADINAFFATAIQALINKAVLKP